jgi:hypothetical protein
MGAVMNYLPEIISGNEEYLSIFKNSWKERKMIEFINLIDEIMLIF